MRAAFGPENVAAMFKLSMSGMSSGLEVHTRVCRDTTQDCTFADLQIPLVAMAVDLNSANRRRFGMVRSGRRSWHLQRWPACFRPTCATANDLWTAWL